MNSILITGISGFAGSFLAEHLLAQNKFTIHGTYHSEKGLKAIDSLQDKVDLHQVDLSEKTAVTNLIEITKPRFVYHLAALASPALSFKDPAKTVETNITGQIHLLESIRNLSKESIRTLIVSSAEVYGAVEKENLPIDEETPFRPTSPYAVSKVTQDLLGLQYQLSYDMDIVRVRPFNHIGPRQKTQYVVASFASQIAQIEKGEKEPILRVGNLEAMRDFTDVTDVVSAYQAVMEKGESGEVYNIGSGASYKIEEILTKLISLSTSSIKVEVDSALFKPVDIPELVCDRTKITEKTGWVPHVSIDDSLKNILDYWRNIS